MCKLHRVLRLRKLCHTRYDLVHKPQAYALFILTSLFTCYGVRVCVVVDLNHLNGTVLRHVVVDSVPGDGPSALGS